MCYSIDSTVNADGSISIKPRYDFYALAAEKIDLQRLSLPGNKPYNRKINIGPVHKEFNPPELPNIFKQLASA